MFLILLLISPHVVGFELYVFIYIIQIKCELMILMSICITDILS